VVLLFLVAVKPHCQNEVIEYIDFDSELESFPDSLKQEHPRRSDDASVFTIEFHKFFRASL
jgi:hypothetical protein